MPIHVPRIIHTIHATTDIYKCRTLYQDVLGGLVFAENYFPAEDRDCALLYVANHMVEPMAPRNPEDLTKPFARMTARIGEAFHSFEIKVENGAAAGQAFRDAGAVTASDYGVFFFVKAESTGGVLLEVCETKMPNDPWDRVAGNPGAWGPAGRHRPCIGRAGARSYRLHHRGYRNGDPLLHPERRWPAAVRRTHYPAPARAARADPGRRYAGSVHPAGRHRQRTTGGFPRQEAERHLRAGLAGGRCRSRPRRTSPAACSICG